MPSCVSDVNEWIYDETMEDLAWHELGDDWRCPVSGSDESEFFPVGSDARTEISPSPPVAADTGGYLSEWTRRGDDLEVHMADIHQMAATGKSIIESMRTRAQTFSWDDILIKGAQLAGLPLSEGDAVNTQTIIGPNAKHPLVIESPIYVTHMYFGALTREVKIALAVGSVGVKTAMCSGEGATWTSPSNVPTSTSLSTCPTVTV